MRRDDNNLDDNNLDDNDRFFATPNGDIERYLRDSVQIEPLALQEEFVRVPADLAYWNQRYAAALRAHLAAKIHTKRTEAALYKKHRLALLDAGEKPTERMIDAEINDDPELHAAQDAEVEAAADKAKVYGIVDAVAAKKDALVSIGAGVRAELRGDPSLRQVARDVRELDGDRRRGGA